MDKNTTAPLRDDRKRTIPVGAGFGLVAGLAVADMAKLGMPRKAMAILALAALGAYLGYRWRMTKVDPNI